MKPKKIRTDIIKSKLRNVIDSVNIVGDNMPEDFKEFEDLGLVKEGIYKKLEFAIESILDICNVINSDLELGTPESEDNILDNVEKNKIINKNVIDKIRNIKKFRNVLVHKYGDIDDKKAFKDIKEGLKDFDAISEEIQKLLKKYK